MSSPAKVNPNVEILRAYFASSSAENKQQAQEAFERIMTGIDNTIEQTKHVILRLYYDRYYEQDIYFHDIFPEIEEIWRLLGNGESVPDPFESEDEEDEEEPPTKAAKTE